MKGDSTILLVETICSHLDLVDEHAEVYKEATETVLQTLHSSELEHDVRTWLEATMDSSDHIMVAFLNYVKILSLGPSSMHPGFFTPEYFSLIVDAMAISMAVAFYLGYKANMDTPESFDSFISNLDFESTPEDDAD